MIDTLFLAITVIAVGLVVYWALINDAAGNTRPTKGFFALRQSFPEKRKRPAQPARPLPPTARRPSRTPD